MFIGRAARKALEMNGYVMSMARKEKWSSCRWECFSVKCVYLTKGHKGCFQNRRQTFMACVCMSVYKCVFVRIHLSVYLCVYPREAWVDRNSNLRSQKATANALTLMNSYQSVRVIAISQRNDVLTLKLQWELWCLHVCVLRISHLLGL